MAGAGPETAASTARRLDRPPPRPPEASAARGWAYSENLHRTRDPFWAMPWRADWLHLDLSIVRYAPEISPLSGSGVFELDGEAIVLKRA